MDITDTPELGSILRRDATVQYPNKPAYNDSLAPLLKELKQKNMYKNLEKFTSFYTRYYRSKYVENLKQFLYIPYSSSVSETYQGLGARNCSLEFFQKQRSGTNSKILKVWCRIIRLAIQ